LARAPGNSSGNVVGCLRQACRKRREETRRRRAESQDPGSAGNTRRRPLPHTATLRKTGRRPRRHLFPTHQHPASAGVRSLPQGTHRPRAAHVDALRVVPSREDRLSEPVARSCCATEMSLAVERDKASNPMSI
jgi:hypothetical protein